MTPPTPPTAARRPVVLTEHGDQRVDDWYWLRERDNPEVVAYLEAENSYADAVLASSRELEDRLFAEIKARIQETDVSAPVPDGPWEYLTRTHEGQQYAVHCRRPRGGTETEETVLLDENVEAEGHDYFSLGVFDISPDHRILAYAIDTNGGERHRLRFRDLDTGADLADEVDGVTYGFAWADDARTCFYVRLDDAMRPWQVWRHALGTRRARRRARVPGGRRPLLRRRVPHPLGPVRRDRDRRRRRPPRRGSSRPRSRAPSSG